MGGAVSDAISDGGWCSRLGMLRMMWAVCMRTGLLTTARCTALYSNAAVSVLTATL